MNANALFSAANAFDEKEFLRRQCELNLEQMHETWGRGDGPYWCDEALLPDMAFSWTRVHGQYVRGPELRWALSGYEFAPWPHCAVCDCKLSKVGPFARCGRDRLRGPQAKWVNAKPCQSCCETGSIVCATCCKIRRGRAELDELRRLWVRGDIFVYQRHMQSDGYCYFVHARCTPMIKIGMSLDPEKRIYDLRNMSPLPLRVIGLFQGGRSLEKHLHEQLHEHRAHGEWFFDCQRLRKVLRNLRLAHERLEDFPRTAALLHRASDAERERLFQA